MNKNLENESAQDDEIIYKALSSYICSRDGVDPQEDIDRAIKSRKLIGKKLTGLD